jgi:NADH-quinone oxidoreductase subunit I
MCVEILARPQDKSDRVDGGFAAVVCGLGAQQCRAPTGTGEELQTERVYGGCKGFVLDWRPMASFIREIGETAVALVKGFSVTFKTMFEKTVTENYPAAPVNFQPRYRGIHVLHRDEGGLEKCVGCFLCAAACPSNCIYIEAAENTEEKRISAGERYAKIYNIDYSRCIFCGYCVEACPTDAITHGHGFELATYDINSLVYRKEQMLEKTRAANS